MALRLGLSTQTPLLRLQGTEPPVLRRLAQAIGIGGGETVLEDEPQVRARLADFSLSPGGVSRMVLQSVRAWHRSGWASDAHWFSLQPNGPRRMLLEDVGIDLHHLRLDPLELQAYARVKERLWADIHGFASQVPGAPPLAPETRFSVEDFRFYARYNHLASDAILAALPDLDLAYVHDFQLLQVGAIVGLAAPCVLRWHVPFEPKRIPAYTRSFLLRMMEAYDGVIVSTRRELEGLSNAGFRGRVRQIYPHSDPEDWAAPPDSAKQELEDRLRLGPDAKVIVLVARMDPMKRQDLAIQAMATVRHRFPTAHLVLVGNGSFSGSSKSGLGLSKSQDWRDHLLALTKELDLEDRVHFTGWMPDHLVAAAYARADVLVLPSDIEGFGLTPFEAWGHGKPCIVSTGCGASEIVQDGVNGLTFQSGDPRGLAQAFERILGNSEEALRMGDAGRITLQSHSPDQAARAEAAFLEEALERFRRRR